MIYHFYNFKYYEGKKQNSKMFIIQIIIIKNNKIKRKITI